MCIDAENIITYVAGLWHMSSGISFPLLKFAMFLCLKGGSKKFCKTFSVLYIVCKFCFILKFTAVFNVNYVKYLFKLF